MSLAQIMLPEFDVEMDKTRRVLEAIPVDKIDWQPNEGLHTIGWNANHIADAVGWTKLIVEQSEFDIAPIDGPKEQVPAESDPAKILATFDANLAAARPALAGCPDEVMAQPWSLKAGGEVLFTVTKGECLRTWVLNHCVHHRAILSVYLRMCGVELTPVYDG